MKPVLGWQDQETGVVLYNGAILDPLVWLRWYVRVFRGEVRAIRLSTDLSKFKGARGR